MRTSLVCFSILLTATGCQPKTQPVAAVSTDTQADLRHHHKHLHGEAQWHDHEHDVPLEGAHAHSHVHGHRHSQTPHDGTLVTLVLDSQSDLSHLPPEQQAVPPGLHLELVEQLPESLSVYFVNERQDQFHAWEIPELNAVLWIEVGENTHRLEMPSLGEDGAFAAALDAPLRRVLELSEARTMFSISSIAIGGYRFVVPETFVYQNGKLDAVLH